MRPTRFDLMLQYAREFITEWFDQNPLGQIGVVGMRAGLGERIGEMSGLCCIYYRHYTKYLSPICTGNPQEVLKSISDRIKLEPSGEPSLQNAIEMACGNMRCYFLLPISNAHPKLCFLKPSTDPFFPRNPDHFWVTYDLRPR